MLSATEATLDETNTSESLQPSTSTRSGRYVPLIGYPGHKFYTIHISALTVISLNTVALIILFIYLFGFRKGTTKTRRKDKAGPGNKAKYRLPDSEKNVDSETQEKGSLAETSTCRKSVNSIDLLGKSTSDLSTGIPDTWLQWRWCTCLAMKCTKKKTSKRKHRVSFWEWNVGERFVVYLGMCDLLFGISHILDHAYMVHVVGHPPDLTCAFFGFLLNQFILSQCLVVITSAISACSLVVFGKKLRFGRWDWKLLTYAFGLPFIIGVFGIYWELLGAAGAWCFINLRTPAGNLYNQIFTAFQVILFGLIALAYGAIWLKIRQTARLVNDSTTERYQNSAKVMMIFVAVFVLQWWPMMFVNIWTLIKDPPPEILVLGVIVINFGGVYNAIAYTIIRRRLQEQTKSSPNNRVVVIGGGSSHGNVDSDEKTTTQQTTSSDTVTSPASSKDSEACSGLSQGPIRSSTASVVVLETRL